MKYIFVSLLSLGAFLSAIAQDQTSGPHIPVDSLTHLVTYEGVIKAAHTGQELFNRTLEWLDTAFRYSTSEIRVADPQSGKIVSRQTVQVVVSGASLNLSYTLTAFMQDGGYRYTFTNIYYDRIGAGIPIVRCEDLMHATRKQLGIWGAGSLEGLQKLINSFLAPLDDCMRQTEGSLTKSLTR
jgi:uncharacterized protein with TBP-like fold DUF4468